MKTALSEDFYQQLIEQSPVFIWRADAKGQFDFHNKHWLDFVGSLNLPRQEAVRHSVHSEDRKRCMATFRSAFTRHEEFQLEYRLRRHDGVYRWISDHGVPFKNQAGEFAGYNGIGVDVTDRVEWEEIIYNAQMAELQKLQALLPICTHCKKIRDDKGYWNQLETYLEDHAEMRFTHALCPKCMEEFYPEVEPSSSDENNTHIGK
jgi:PAS domain S-box-containing protein